MGTKNLLIDLVGQRFGKLLVIERAPNGKLDKVRWKCVCDCGNTTESQGSSLRSGTAKTCGCSWKTPKLNRANTPGPSNINWRGGRFIDDFGYVRIRVGSKYQKEHRVIMEHFLKRKLTRRETVHHKNGIRTDNRIENLELYNSNHGPGQRVEDLIEFWTEKLREYAPERLDEDWL